MIRQRMDQFCSWHPNLYKPLGSNYAAAQTGTAPRVASICVPCRGLDGIGHDVEIPNIAGQHSSYLRNQLMAFKKRERKHPEMRSIAPALSEKEIDELVVYYSTLPSSIRHAVDERVRKKVTARFLTQRTTAGYRRTGFPAGWVIESARIGALSMGST